MPRLDADTEKTLFFFSHSSPVCPHAFDRRTLKDRHLVQGGFLEEVRHEHVLLSEQGLGVSGGGGCILTDRTE